MLGCVSKVIVVKKKSWISGEKNVEQAGAELCQAQHLAGVSLFWFGSKNWIPANG